MKNKFYVTSSIAYTNAPPHVGFALELVQADVTARYHRLLNEDVFFLTGTDEHGLKIARAAVEAGKTPKDFTDGMAKKFKDLAKTLHLSNDDFIRTTDEKRHWPNVQKVWLKLKENGDIYKKAYRGLYCIGCEAFVKEKDLVDGKCPIHQKKPETIEEENYFFKLSRYAATVKEKIESGEMKIIPDGRKNEILSFIQQGIEDVSCSRSRANLKWGIPVPGDDSQTIYVWFEALVNYLFPEKYWPADVHCLGKDIFRFHALWWPAMLLALGKPLPKTILVHGFITFGGQKMSKSLGNVADPFELIKKYGADALRYFLLREIPSTEDGDFTEEKFIDRYNGDLAAGLGNLVARTLTLFAKLSPGDITGGIKISTKIVKEKYQKALGDFKFNEALIAIWELITSCDKYIEKEKPWASEKTEVVANLVVAIKEIANLLEPLLPETSEKILKQLKSKKSEPLFPRI